MNRPYKWISKRISVEEKTVATKLFGLGLVFK
jgi:hypothetical protein